MGFDLFIFAAGAVAGAVAAVAGFGIGSLLTPAFATAIDTKLAVAAVSIPHVVGTGLRFWTLRGHVDRQVLWRFGIASAAGGLTGALLHEVVSTPSLTMLFGGLLVFVAALELTGAARRLQFHGAVAWIAGAVSGLLGGLVGNQGGIRSAALLGFDLERRTFIATVTAVALIVDGARVPVYIATEGRGLTTLIWAIVAATAGVAAGTLFGGRLLARMPERAFRPAVAIILALLGIAMLIQGVRA